MKARVVLMGGMGYPLTETPWGMPSLKKKLEPLGCDVCLISWKDRQGCRDFLHGYSGFRALIGDSLGAGSAAQYAGDLDGSVNFVGGFQPSMYDARAMEGHKIDVAANVIRAHAIYDPVWIDTAGLGYASYTQAIGANTIVLNTEHRGAHPDDWGYAQALMLISFEHAGA